MLFRIDLISEDLFVCLMLAFTYVSAKLKMLLPLVARLFALELRAKIGVVVNDNGPPTSIGESAFVAGLPPEFLDVLARKII